MELTKKWLKEQSACEEGIDWFVVQKETDGLIVVKKLVDKDKWNWANWLIVRLMSYRQQVSYAVFAAEQVIGIYEKKYPDDKRPRQAIEAAKNCMDNLTQKNKAPAHAAHAAHAAYAAAHAAYAAYAAYAAADAAAYAAYAAYAAAYAAADAAAYAAYAAAYAAMKKKIIKFGIKLLEAKNG